MIFKTLTWHSTDKGIKWKNLHNVFQKDGLYDRWHQNILHKNVNHLEGEKVQVICKEISRVGEAYVGHWYCEIAGFHYVSSHTAPYRRELPTLTSLFHYRTILKPKKPRLVSFRKNHFAATFRKKKRNISCYVLVSQDEFELILSPFSWLYFRNTQFGGRGDLTSFRQALLNPQHIGYWTTCTGMLIPWGLESYRVCRQRVETLLH